MLVNKRYQSYLLRIWQVRENTQISWLLSLENPHTGNRYGFADVDDFCAFLHQQIDGNNGICKGSDDEEIEGYT